MKEIFSPTLLLQVILFVLVCTSCSNDDENIENGSSTVFTVNGTKISKILYTLCEISPSPKEMVLEAHFGYDDSTYSLNMALYSIKSLDGIKAGDKFDADDFDIYKFYPMSGAFIGSQYYEPLSGSATVKSISNKALVMEYSSFKFSRELGSKEETFTINGTISYTIND